MITPKQIAALKYLIFNAKYPVELSKRILALLIDQSEGLTRGVCLTVVENREGYNAVEIHVAAQDIGEMQSCNGTVHVNELFQLMGSEFNCSCHYGDFDPTRVGDKFSAVGQFAGYREDQVNDPELIREGLPIRYTFWLSKEYYSREATLVVATRKELEQIDLRKSGLYLDS